MKINFYDVAGVIILVSPLFWVWPVYKYSEKRGVLLWVSLVAYWWAVAVYDTLRFAHLLGKLPDLFLSLRLPLQVIVFVAFLIAHVVGPWKVLSLFDRDETKFEKGELDMA